MNIKTKIFKSIQNNLDKKSIRRMLRIISKKPVLQLFGTSFKSTSDRELNFLNITNMNEVYSKKFPVAYGSLFLPYELINGLGLKPFMPEVMGGFTAGLGVTDKTLKAASDKWYSSDLCTFHRSSTGAFEMDLFPEPDFILSSNLACDAAGKSFESFASKYNMQDRFYLIDVPHFDDDNSIDFLSRQLENIYEDIFNKLKKKPEKNLLEKSINHSNEFRKLALEANKIREDLLDYPLYFNGLNFILPFHGLCGTKESVKLYRAIVSELKGKLAGQQKNKQMKRVLWLHLKPYYRNDIFKILEDNNIRVIFEEISNVYWKELDPSDPFKSLALKMLSNPLRGSGKNRIAAINNLAKRYKADGVIMFSHWGCRQSNGLSRLLKDSLALMNIPMLILDGDCVDSKNCPGGQMKTRVEGFVEILNSL